MRIAHVVTYTSTDGAFGGPTRVALGQAKALAALGHEVTVFAGAPRDEVGDGFQDGYRLRTFPVRRVAPFGGFATLRPVGMTKAIRQAVGSIDVAHVHLARDLATLPAALAFSAAGTPYVTQTHGMIDAPRRLDARLLDVLATKRALAKAKSWLVLTDTEQVPLSRLAKATRVHRIANGVEVGPIPPFEGRNDDILFLARLHERKRPLAFVEMARALADRLPESTFTLVGPDEGEGDAVAASIASSGLGPRLRWVGPHAPSETATAMKAARVYVLPSINEVFPMSILEAFAAGTPVVTTSSLGIAEACRSYGAALVTDGSVPELADAVASVHDDAGVADRLRRGAQEYLERELDVRSVARNLIEEYSRARRG